jgi:NADP-dependent 3-hydroxy acid dehydrogenase YdfG
LKRTLLMPAQNRAKPYEREQLMTAKLTGTVALVTGASSGSGDATARALAGQGASVAVVARRKDRLDTLVAEIKAAGGTNSNA